MVAYMKVCNITDRNMSMTHESILDVYFYKWFEGASCNVRCNSFSQMDERMEAVFSQTVGVSDSEKSP